MILRYVSNIRSINDQVNMYLLWIELALGLFSLIYLLFSALYLLVSKYLTKSNKYILLKQNNNVFPYLEKISFMEKCFPNKNSFFHSESEEFNKQYLKEYEFKPWKQSSIIISEGLIILFIIIIFLSLSFLNERKEYYFNIFITRIYTWVVIYFHTCYSSKTINTTLPVLSILWYHTCILYAFQWPLFYIDLLSALISHESST
ncbi:hypothetical protein PCK1_000170 [Pneumocystis canis]|nr:hypothetical protein PCK1_000170 [Pneumocystis canis]